MRFLEGSRIRPAEPRMLNNATALQLRSLHFSRAHARHMQPVNLLYHISWEKARFLRVIYGTAKRGLKYINSRGVRRLGRL